MHFKRIDPSPELAHIIECLWILESSNPPTVQKIIPDGFPEIIFHYRDAYKINIGGTWEDLEKQLLAGQIRMYFFLENTGVSGMFGI
jgi:hypothetical protein